MFEILKFIETFFKLPAPTHYSEWVKIYTDMAVHTKKVKPVDLLLSRRPNETDEVHAYRLCQYRAITYGSMNRATDELYRIVSGINFKLNCPESTRVLIEEKTFGGFTFMLYIQQIVLRRMIEDPNGLLVWLPPGSYNGDSSVKIVPTPLIVCSRDIHYCDENVVSWLSEEKSLVRVNKTDTYEGLVYYILTKNEFYKLKQVGRKGDNQFQLELIYEHGIGEIPYMKLGGDMLDNGYFDSFFAPYLAFGDEAICQFSDWQAIMVTSSHPIREEFGTECEMEEVKDKPSNPVPEGQEEYVRKRYVLRPMSKSPYNTIIRKVPGNENNAFATAQLDPAIPSVRFIHPDIEVARYCGESWQKLVEMAEDSLHLNLGRGLLSGAAKVEDKKAQASMILKIGNNVFDNLILNSAVFVDAYHSYTPANRKVITIDKPKTYDIKSETEILEEIKTLKESNSPSIFIANAAMNLARKSFSGDRLMEKMFKIVALRDPLYIYNVTEMNQLKMGGSASTEQCIVHVNIFTLLYNIVNDKGVDWFILAPTDKIIEEFNKIIVPLLPEKQTPIVDPNGEVVV